MALHIWAFSIPTSHWVILHTSLTFISQMCQPFHVGAFIHDVPFFLKNFPLNSLPDLGAVSLLWLVLGGT